MASINLERQSEISLKIPKCVGVVGCGGVGSWVAYVLALSGVENIWLFDYDTVSDHNLNRLPVPQSEIGQLKTEAVKRLILSVRPDSNVYSCGKFIPRVVNMLSDFCAKVNCIVATTDTKASRLEVMEWAKEVLRYKRIKYYEAAAEGETGSATSSVPEWCTPQENQPGYASVPVWVGPCIASAYLVVNHILHGKEMVDNTHRLGWNKTTDTLEFYSEQDSVEYEEVEVEEELHEAEEDLDEENDEEKQEVEF